jgi:hypothetical protein
MSLSESRRIETWSDPVSLAKSQKYKQTRLWAWMRETWIGALSRAFRKFRYEVWAWVSCEQVTLPRVEKLSESIALLQAGTADTAGAESEREAPIFLLSTGWRAGSTLLQRVLVTDPRLLIWGEPLGEMTIASKLAEMMSDFISPRNLRLWREQDDPSSANLSISWVANLYPSGSEFRMALRSLFDQWLRGPAQKRGFTRWGF